MDPLHLSAYRVASDIGVPVSRIQDLLHDRRRVSIDTSIRLGKYFNVGHAYFLNLQNSVDIQDALEEAGDRYDSIKPLDFKVQGQERMSG